MTATKRSQDYSKTAAYFEERARKARVQEEKYACSMSPLSIGRLQMARLSQKNFARTHQIGTTEREARWDAMPIISKPIRPKTGKTAVELEAALNKAIHAHPECQGVKVSKLTPLENNSGLANWDADFAADPGVTMSPECKRALISAKQGVQKHFDLAGGG
jgi:hypothetical protein